MKKRLLAAFLALTLILLFTVQASASSSAAASELTEGSTVVLHKDGSYTTISEVVLENTVAPAAIGDTHSITAHITATNTKSNGTVNWVYTLYGSFTYVEGVSSVCTSAWYTHTINTSGWTINDPATSYSGDTAYGYALFRKKVLFVTTENVTIDLHITCDSYGNLSS